MEKICSLVKPDKRGRYTASVARALKSAGVIVDHVKHGYYSEDGHITIVGIDRINPADVNVANLNKARDVVDAIASSVGDSNAVIIRYVPFCSILHAAPGALGYAEGMAQRGTVRPEYFE